MWKEKINYKWKEGKNMQWLIGKKEPVFLKQNSNIESKIDSLKALRPTLNKKGQKLIDRDINFLEYGMAGEKNIEFELKNSHMPMYVLHDVYLEHKGLSAQIDYLVFTKKICFVIECKNLYGNIEINSNSDFIRTMEFNGYKKREGIYSPITQNQRHMDLIRTLLISRKKSFLMKISADKLFYNSYNSIVVLANPKTILKTRYAKKEVKEKVIRADQLVTYIKDTYKASKEPKRSDKEMREWAEAFLKYFHKDIEKDYTQKYKAYMRNTDDEDDLNNLELESNVIEETEIYKTLKNFRLKESRKEKIKAYYIFTNSELENIITAMPKNKEELLKINGFGERKVEKYGAAILEILKKY